MSVNNNANIPAENPFANLDGLKNANLTENEKTVLSNCDYKDFAEKWYKSLGNISAQAHTHINRNVKEIKEGIFRQLGAAMGFCSFDPWKETQQVFSDWKSFDGYIRMKISSETYQKIAKANPQYFDKVIEHLEQVADNLDKMAKVRLDTFVSNQSGETLAMLASDFRSTAAFLRMKMNGDDAAKPGNNNAKPVANPGDRPTVINHYHNNIGHIGDNYFGDNHFGDNNFYNKGNMGVMFKESSNGVPHTGFKSERPALESPNSFYSPSINGKRFLNLTPIQVAELALEGNKDKGKKLEMQRNTELMFEAHKPLPKEKPENIKQTVDSISFAGKEPESLKKFDVKKLESIRADEFLFKEKKPIKTDGSFEIQNNDSIMYEGKSSFRDLKISSAKQNKVNVQQKSDQLSKIERMKQFSEGIKIQNKNLKKIDETKEKPQEPSAREKSKKYSKNVVVEHNKDMKTDNPPDPKKTWISNDGSNMQRTSDGKHYKNYNSNVTNPLFHRHAPSSAP